MVTALGEVGADSSIGYCACLRRKLSGEPDVGDLHLRFDEGRGTFSVLSYSTTRASVKDATEGTRLGLIVRDESHRVSLSGLLSSRARLRFPGCSQFAMKVSGRSRDHHRAASSVLTGCLNSGGHRR